MRRVNTWKTNKLEVLLNGNKLANYERDEVLLNGSKHANYEKEDVLLNGSKLRKLWDGWTPEKQISLKYYSMEISSQIMTGMKYYSMEVSSQVMRGMKY